MTRIWPAWGRVLLTGCVTLLAGCTAAPPAVSRPSAGPAAGTLAAAPGRLVDQPVASTGCGHQPSVRPGTTGRLYVAVPPAAAAGSRQRTFWLHVPARYNPAHAVPLVLAFHGSNGTAPGMQAGSGLSGLADRDGFLVAYPQGLVQDHGKGPAGWDVSGPRDPFADGIDDGLFVSDVLTAVQAGYCVDPRRIAATGMSNGGGLAGYLACVLAARIAVFVPVEGEFNQIPGGCHPAHPAAILDVHVTADPVAPYAGVPSRGSPDYYALAIPAWLRAWAFRDGCQAGPQVYSASPHVTAVRWTGCPDGAAVSGYRLASGGHSWFGALGALNGDTLILAFLAAHPLAGPVPHWAPRLLAPAPALTAPRITASLRQFRVPTPGAEPFDITAGPDGSMWFTEFHADKIGRISPSGTISEYRVPTPGAGPYQIAAGPGGTMWFTEYNTAKIGRVSRGGQVTEITLPEPSLGGDGITQGPGHTVWVADPAGYADTISVAGHISRTRLPGTGGVPFAILARAGGDAMVSEFTGYFEHSRLLLDIQPGRPPATALMLPGTLSDIDALAAGPGESVWFTDFGASQIGELRPDGTVRLFPDQAAYAGLSDITRGPDDAMWYTEQAGLIGRITANGTISQLALPEPGSNPDGIAAGPAGTLWITNTGTGIITRITLPSASG